ncbi:hypothetical protein [Nostoc sp.]|uniref:hypothetical protein n=1 Tax=Nostoc sp. TaxID=1180 RepID=UPI002FFAC894
MEVGGKLHPASGVERDSRPPIWGIGHWALGTLTHALKLHATSGVEFFMVIPHASLM